MHTAKEFIALLEDGGFTYDLRTDRLLRVGSVDGYLVARKRFGVEIDRRQVAEQTIGLLIYQFYYEHPERLDRDPLPSSPTSFVGGRIADDVLRLDIVEYVADLGVALMLGASEEQESIFNLKTGERIFLNQA